MVRVYTMIAILTIILSLLGYNFASPSEAECSARVPPLMFGPAPAMQDEFEVPAELEVPAACPTCSCRSSSNAKFYHPSRPETCCGASEAKYHVTFVSTWTNPCHPDYYFPNAHWSPLTGVSHDHTYEVWNACMKKVSPGVALVSQRGNVTVMEAEYLAQGSSVKDIIRGNEILSDGTVTVEFSVDCSHPFVTVLTMLVPSQDRMIGVAGLKLCNGDTWKSSVKVCAELFSTATKSERVDLHKSEQLRNSVQFEKCSFGYFEFNLTEGGDLRDPPDADSCTCQPKVPHQCPRERDVRKVKDCCCKSTDNVKFYLPKGPNPVCRARGNPNYRVRFKSSWREVSHPDYYFPTAHWSPLTGVSHNPKYEVWNPCMFDVSRGVAQVSQDGQVRVIQDEYAAQGNLVKDVILGTVIRKDGETFANFTVSSTHNYVSVLTMLAPSVDWMAGVSRLDLCNGKKWRRYVKVCAELFSTATKSDRVATPNSIQMNNCSFGYFEFRNMDVCYKTGLTANEISKQCNKIRFSMVVKIIGGKRIQSAYFDEYFNITASVIRVHKMRGRAKPHDIVSFLVCDLPNEMLKNDRPRSQISLLVMGRIVKDYGLVVDGSGYLEKRQRDSGRKARSC